MDIKVSRIARWVDGELLGDPNVTISGAAPFEKAGPGEITWAGSPRFLKRLEETGAGAVIVPKKTPACSSRTLICVENPQVAFAKVMASIYPAQTPEPGISSMAHVGPRFSHGEAVTLFPFVFVGKEVRIGDRVVLHPGVVVGDGVVIGNDVTVHPNVTLAPRCRIGNRVIIHAGTVIGSDGFGFAPDGERYHKIPHMGIVQIDDDVEIGANNAIDRGTFGKTWIQEGVKTDNLVHVAHNVTVGAHTVLVAQVGISGSVTIGRHAVLAGQAGVAGHLEIGDHAIVGPQAGVAKSVEKGKTVSGSVAMPHGVWLRVQRTLPKLPELYKKVLEMEKRLKRIEEENGKSL